MIGRLDRKAINARACGDCAAKAHSLRCAAMIAAAQSSTEFHQYKSRSRDVKKIKAFSLLCGLGCAPILAAAQSPSFGVTIYGDIDQYLNYMHSSSGAKVKALEDGEWLRSRIGFRGI